MMGNVADAHPGCLTAAFTYQDQLFSQEIRDLNAKGLMRWRVRFRERFAVIAERYPPRIDVDFDGLADMAISLIEGGLILNRALNDPKLLGSQILLYRDFIRLIFAPLPGEEFFSRSGTAEIRSAIPRPPQPAAALA
jgi:hypothetical protein